MLFISRNIQPAPEILTKLASYQAAVDAEPTFAARSAKAKSLFKRYNVKGNAVFEAIKKYLLVITPGIERCVYCEDSKCDEVEHIKPKDLYPLHCFLWSNYVYACGPCNGPKNNLFAIFRRDNGQFYEVNPPNNKIAATEPPEGDCVLIDPRSDNPLDFCMLDLENFKFCILPDKGTREYERADYTFNKVLRLNEQREYLRAQRELAYDNYKQRLYCYTDLKAKGASQDKLDKLINNLKRESHPTVWKEMQRQYTMGYVLKIDEDLHKLFLESPEALTW
jgi:hypothetical protein